MAKTRRMLVVDWDYFFNTTPSQGPQKYIWDWGHNEGLPQSLQTHLWTVRAAGFQKYDLPLPMTVGNEGDFWSRFRLTEGAKLFVADSNVKAVSPCVWGAAGARTAAFDEVWLYDAHHDCGYQRSVKQIQKSGQVNCEDWCVAAMMFGADVHVRYPKWRADAFSIEMNPSMKPATREFDDGKPNPRLFDQVFICRSGTWVPSWCDAAFEAFIAACPVDKKLVHVFDCPPRSFNQADVDKHVRQVEEVMGKVLEPDLGGQYFPEKCS